MRDRGRSARTRLGLIAAFVGACAALAGPSAASAATYPEAVLLVSGFDTQAPYTTPDPSCAGKEGPEWSLPDGIATTLRQGGLNVFTAPVQQAQVPLPPPCAAPGDLLPSNATVINSNGEVDENGRALAALIEFMRAEYGVEKLHLVGYSDGGLWSRSAITQNGVYDGVEVLSLTTLGTPHTGSLVADLAIQLNGGKCDFSGYKQLICDAVIAAVQVMVTELGKTATAELTNGFLTPWNQQQRIGSCPVTGIAGNAVGFNIPLLEYYTPSDGAVGLGSALGEKTLAIDGSTIPAPGIPNFIQGGTYDVVHTPSLSFYSEHNLLNTAAISAEVRTRVTNAQSNTTPCNVSGPQADILRGAELGVSLHRLRPPNRRGLLARPDDGELVAAKRDVKVKCDGAVLDSTIYRGNDRVSIFDGAQCDSRMRVPGNRRHAVLLDAARSSALLRVLGDRLTVKITGPDVRGLRVVAWSGGERRRLRLDGDDSATLPDGERTWVRIRARTKPGGVIATGSTLLPR